MPMRADAPTRGFSLIEAVVALMILAILAGAIAPLAVKALNQQREYKTRDSLKACFEACFGARDRRVANMRADFGFDPASSLSGLGLMVNTGGTLWSGVPVYGYNNSASFLWGWNGPYWAGSVDASNNPVDAWGHAIQLTVSGGAFQVVSGGPDGSVATAGDNLVYPNVAPSYLAYNATVNVVITRASSSSSGSLVVQAPYGASGGVTTHASPSFSGTPSIGTLGSLGSIALSNSPQQTLNFNVPAGGIQMNFTPSGGGTFTATTLTLDLLPGETRQLDLTL